MTLGLGELALYALALLILFLTPGPVWVALIARGVSGGFHAAWPLALGVAFGDLIWPLVAIFGVSAIVAVYADFLIVLRFAAAVILIAMGLALIRYSAKALTADSALTRPGMWAGFAAGVLAVTANPKASLFYMAILPSFFDFTRITLIDIVVICIASFVVPLFGNLTLSLFVSQIRRYLSSPGAVKRTNIIAGTALILVGAVIAVT